VARVETRATPGKSKKETRGLSLARCSLDLKCDPESQNKETFADFIGNLRGNFDERMNVRIKRQLTSNCVKIEQWSAILSVALAREGHPDRQGAPGTPLRTLGPWLLAAGRGGEDVGALPGPLVGAASIVFNQGWW